MSRLSFRNTLLASFLVIAGLLAAVAASGWQGLEAFTRASHESNRHALALSQALQQVTERTIDIERSARQFTILGDPMLADRFRTARDEALHALAILDANLTEARILTESWREHMTTVENTTLNAAPAPSEVPPPQLATSLAAFASINDRLGELVRSTLETRNQSLLDALERKRDQLALQIMAALALAFALAALTGRWLLRPLARIETAIAELGADKLNNAIHIDGPEDLRQVGERLDWLRLRLAELEANRNRVLRHVSHELKTPLASLREGVALLADGILGRLSTEQGEVVTILNQNVRALQERIEQLLHYNATQFDARRLERSATRVRAVFNEVITELQLQSQARGLSVELGGEDPTVAADAGKLRIAFSNLLANAIAFSPEAGTVRVNLRHDTDRVLIDCMDEGPGIAHDELQRIFEPFFQGSRRTHNPIKGTGVGLAIVRELIAAHSGLVYALPTDQGAHFRIELPHVA
jgi:two-component system, NtrC family, sensor histidine kinase GlrK